MTVYGRKGAVREGRDVGLRENCSVRFPVEHRSYLYRRRHLGLEKIFASLLGPNNVMYHAVGLPKNDISNTMTSGLDKYERKSEANRLKRDM